MKCTCTLGVHVSSGRHLFKLTILAKLILDFPQNSSLKLLQNVYTMGFMLKCSQSFGHLNYHGTGGGTVKNQADVLKSKA